MRGRHGPGLTASPIDIPAALREARALAQAPLACNPSEALRVIGGLRRLADAPGASGSQRHEAAAIADGMAGRILDRLRRQFGFP